MCAARSPSLETVAFEPIEWEGEFAYDDYFLEADEEEDDSQLPLGAAAVILALCFSEGLSASILNPFCGLMVQEEFGIASADVGYWVGLLTASFFLGQLMSSFPIGMAADRVGRRPVLLVGIVGNIVTLSMFGFSKWMWWAMLWRFLGGVTNGNNSVVKTYIRDISTDKTQAKMYSLRSSMRASGFLVGPIIGGFLSRPAETEPFSIAVGAFHSLPGLFIRFPYLLPCLFAAVLNVVMLFTGICLLRETLVKKEKLRTDSNVSLFGSGTELNTLISRDGEGENASTPTQESPTFLSAFKRDVVLSISLYGFISLIWVGFQETFPVWAIRTHEENGLGFNEAQLGLINGLCASGMIIFQAFFYSPLDHKFGTLNLFRGLLMLWGPVFVVVPLIQRFVDFPLVVWTGLLSTMFILNAFGTALMAGSNLMINNAADAERIGLVNGMGTFCSAAARVFAPVLSTTVFTATANGSIAFPFNYAFVFLCMAAVCAVCLGVTILLDSRVNRRIESTAPTVVPMKVGMSAQERQMAERASKEQLQMLNFLVTEQKPQSDWDPCVV